MVKAIEEEWPEEELNMKRTERLENMFILTPEENEMIKMEESIAEEETQQRKREQWLEAFI